MTRRVLRVVESLEDIPRLAADEMPISVTPQLADLVRAASGEQCAYIGSFRTREHSYRAATEDYAACFNAWSTARTEEGIALRDLFCHDGQSVWDMVEPDFYWTLLYGFDEWRLVERVLDEISPDEVRLSRATRFGEIFTEVCAQRQISVSAAPSAKRFKRYRHEGGGSWIARLPWPIVGLVQTARSMVWWISSRKPTAAGPFDVLYFAMGRDSGVGSGGLREIVETASRGGQSLAVVDWRFSSVINQIGHAPVVGFERFLNWTAVARTWRARWRFARAVRKVRTDRALTDALGKHRGRLFQALLPEIESIVRWCMPAAVEAYETMRHLVRSSDARVVVMTDKHERAARGMALACRREGVTSIGLPGRAGEYMDREKTGAPIQLLDWKLVDGEAMREWLIEQGCRPERVIVTGNPYTDRSALDTQRARHDLCARLELDMTRPIVTLLTSPTTEINRADDKLAFVSGVISAVTELTDVQLVVKLHPAERARMEEDVLARAGITLSRFRIVQHVSLRDVMAGSDVVVFSNSTAGHEAVALGKNLVQVNLSRSEGDVIPCAEVGAAVPGYHAHTIRSAIEAALFDTGTQARLEEGRRRYVERYMHKIDGRATERIAGAVQAIVRDRTAYSAVYDSISTATETS